MRCEHAGEMMSARLDGRLSGAESEVLDSHLAACSKCRAEWRALLSVDQFLASPPLSPAPGYLRSRVMARVERRQWARRVAVGGAALALGTVVLAMLTLAPVLLGLTNAGSALNTLLIVGGEAVAQAAALIGTAARTGAVLLRAFALPTAGFAVCAMIAAAFLTALWIGTLHRLRVAQ